MNPDLTPMARRMAGFERHLGRPLCSGERAAFAEGWDAGAGLGRDLPCPYRGELAPVWEAGRVAHRAVFLRMEPAWPAPSVCA